MISETAVAALLVGGLANDERNGAQPLPPGLRQIARISAPDPQNASSHGRLSFTAQLISPPCCRSVQIPPLLAGLGVDVPDSGPWGFRRASIAWNSSRFVLCNLLPPRHRCTKVHTRNASAAPKSFVAVAKNEIPCFSSFPLAPWWRGADHPRT